MALYLPKSLKDKKSYLFEHNNEFKTVTEANDMAAVSPGL